MGNFAAKLINNIAMMKKWMLLMAFFTLFCACTSETVETSNSAFQTLKNNTFWKANNFKAYLQTDGSLVIEGSSAFEKVTLKTTSLKEETYIISTDSGNQAFYTNSESEKEFLYSTENVEKEGQIVITNFNASNNTVSGTFRFIALNDDETTSEDKEIDFTEGVFYKIPIETDPITHQE